VNNKHGCKQTESDTTKLSRCEIPAVSSDAPIIRLRLEIRSNLTIHHHGKMESTTFHGEFFENLPRITKKSRIDFSKFTELR